MEDPLIADLAAEENPLLSSLVNTGRKPPKKGGRPGPVPPEGRRVNASNADPLRQPLPPKVSPLSSRPASDTRTVPPTPPDSARSVMSSSVASASMSEASLDLLGAFTTLKKKNGWNSAAAYSAEIERMDRNSLVAFAKQLYGIVETFSLKAEDEDGFSLSGSDNNLPLPQPPGDESPVGLNRNSSTVVGGSMVFRRRPTNRPGSAGSVESSASVMRAPVVESGKLEKSKNTDGETKINDYSIIAELGRGAYGKVKLAQNDLTGQPVAIKIMKKALLKGHESVVAKEIAIMKKLRHRNIVSLYEVINDPEAAKIYLVMQYVECGPLYILNKKDMTCTPLDEVRVLKVLRQLISGLRYLHKRNIVHRDIKPDNILIGSDGTPYLADFGVSEIAKTGTVHNLEGTPMFLAPELFRGDQHIDGCATDVWALGITIYGALFGRLPFVGKNHEAVSKAVQSYPLQFPADSPITSRWRDVLNGLLEKDPKRRMTLKELKQHPIFRELERGQSPTARDVPHAVEVTDLELMESMRVVQGFASKEKRKSRFQVSVRARMIIHRYVANLRRRVQGKHLGLEPVGGSGMTVIRGMRAGQHSPTSARKVSVSLPVVQPHQSKFARVAEQDSGAATSPRLPTLRRMLRKAER